jgi:hypothetical protein
MSHAGRYVGDVHFTLNGRCNFQKVRRLSGIHLETKRNKDNTTSIQGFKVRVESFTEEEALDTAKIKAKRLVDILAVLSGGHLSYFLRDHSIQSPGGRTRVTSTIRSAYDIISPQPLDLRRRNVARLITTLKPKGKDRRLSDRIGYANNGLEAYRNELYGVMIKEFYLAIADKPRARKYKPLRHALSHHERLEPWTRKKLEKNFGKGYFDLPYGKFDHSSPKNRENLQKEAIKIMEIALGYLRREL